MSDTAAILNEAYGLIEQGELTQARTMLQPLLESDSQNPDVWWLYTHAAEDENEGRRALERVLALDPEYPGAVDLGQKLGVGPRVLKPLSSLKPLPQSPAPAPVTATVPAAPILTRPVDPDMDDDDFAETETGRVEGRRFPSLLMIAGLIIVVLGLLWFAASMLNQPTVVTPTAVADMGTPIPTTTVDLMTPSEVVDLMSTVDTTTATTSAIDEFSQTATSFALTPEVDDFAQTATALVAIAMSTSEVNAQVATEDSNLATLESLAVVTDESSLLTAESLLPMSTAAVLATEAVVATEEFAATEDMTPVVTEAIVATEDMMPMMTEAVMVTPDVVVTPDVTPDATDPTDLILPTATESTSINVVSTEEAGLILTEAATTEAIAEPADRLAAKLEALNVTPDDILVAQTSLGATLIVEVCAVPVAGATSALVTSMNALAETIVDVPDVDAVGVNLACDETRPRVIAVSSLTAAAYGRGEIDARTFRQGWQPTDLIDDEGNG